MSVRLSRFWTVTVQVMETEARHSGCPGLAPRLHFRTTDPMRPDKLIVFVKAPVAGQVKTRLARAVGAAPAAAIYRRMVEIILGNLAALEDVEIHYAPADARGAIEHWLRPGWDALPQTEGSLGDRLIASFESAFERGAHRVVLIGTDCPEVTAQDIRDAWRALSSNDLVLGPATDGGYWLIGLAQRNPTVFENITWSSSLVLEQTLAHAREFMLKTQLLRELSDVDTEEDWIRCEARLA